MMFQKQPRATLGRNWNSLKRIAVSVPGSRTTTTGLWKECLLNWFAVFTTRGSYYGAVLD